MPAGEVFTYYYIDSENCICREAGNVTGDIGATLHINSISAANLINKA